MLDPAMKKQKIVSLVPSWTETLIRAGAHVVGRTRFCIHPQEEIEDIPEVGGTKEVRWNEIRQLQPDLILFDKEENPLSFSEECPFPWRATHVTNLDSCQQEMKSLSQELKLPKLEAWAQELEGLLKTRTHSWDSLNIPGELEKLRGTETSISRPVMYIIWKKPWMAVGRETFIGSVLNYLGAQVYDTGEKYPTVTEEEMKGCHLLFSSEPYPFLKKKSELLDDGWTGSLIDGEKFSWFGLRSLEFLKSLRT